MKILFVTSWYPTRKNPHHGIFIKEHAKSLILAGYIGSHTIVKLINSGYNPTIIDNLCNTSVKNIHGIENKMV